MVTVCAWCKRYLGIGDTDPPLMISHSICDPCAERLRWSEAPVLVVSRRRAEMIPVLRSLLEGTPEVRVISDQRIGGRRATEQRRSMPFSGSRPTRDRRQSDDRRQGAPLMLA